MIALGKTCKYCPKCELIIVHQDELEDELTSQFQERDPSVIGNDYLILGTVEQKVRRENLSEPKPIAEMLAYVADFKGYRDIEYFPAHARRRVVCRVRGEPE